MDIIGRRIGVDVTTLGHCSRLLGAACIGYDPRYGIAVQYRPVSAEWLVLLLLAAAVGDDNDMIQRLKSMRNTFLSNVVTQQEDLACVWRDEERVLTSLAVTTHYDPKSTDWGLKNGNVFQILVGLVEQIAYAPKGEHHEFLGANYRVDISWSHKVLYFSIEANLEAAADETVIRKFIFEHEATRDTPKSWKAYRPLSESPISKTRTLGYFHLQIIAEVLAAAYDDCLSGMAHWGHHRLARSDTFNDFAYALLTTES